MHVRLTAMTCGWLTVNKGMFLEGEQGSLKVPVPCYLIEHPKGSVLFDTGMHPDAQRDPTARLGRLAAFHEVDFQAGEELAARLATVGVEADRVRYVINSHLHFDHCGGNEQVPNATLVVQNREWQAAHDADLAQANAYLSHDYDHGHDLLTVDGEHDLFNDGSVVCIPTYGHTPGHQSLRVRTKVGEIVLAADACYLRRTLEQLHLPLVLHDRGAMLASLHSLRRLRQRGARIFFGHDPEFWRSVAQAPAPVA